MMLVGTLIVFAGLAYLNLALHCIVMHTLMIMHSC
jgi:hypothetical protein